MRNLKNLKTVAMVELCRRQRYKIGAGLRKHLIPKIVGGMLGVALIGGGTSYAVQQHSLVLEQQQQLHTLQSDFDELHNRHYQTVEELDTLQNKNQQLQDEKEELEQTRDALEEEKADLERQLQAKREAQRQSVVLASAPTGSCTDWISQAGVSDVNNAYWLIMHESGCNPRATNTSSGAYGIPQALPGAKMASAGSDWQTNPITQIRWMDGYVKSRYGGWAQAVAFWQANHWY